jgi:uncharacterized membrane protein SirB2
MIIELLIFQIFLFWAGRWFILLVIAVIIGLVLGSSFLHFFHLRVRAIRKYLRDVAIMRGMVDHVESRDEGVLLRIAE